jgi:hypothetical protein
MLDINKFKSQIQLYDVERPNLFDTIISIPKNMPQQIAAYMGGLGDQLRLFAQNATLPGVQISTAPTKRYGLGPNQLMPIGVEFNNTSTITYIADGSGLLYQLFYLWIRQINPAFNQRPAAGIVVPATVDGVEQDTANPTFVLSYQSSYVSEIKITSYRGAPGKFGGSGLEGVALSAASAALGAPFIGSILGGLSNPDYKLEPIRTVTLFKAYPIALSEMSLSSSSGDSYSTFSVTFAYYNWNQEVFDSKKADESSGGFF